MNKEKILQRLCNDEDYYGEFGNQYLSNSHVGKLLKDPLRAFEPSKPSPAFLVGGYFHTCILEPDKLEKFKVVKSSSRNTKAYKDVAGGELCLLQHEVDTIELMREKVMDNDICRDLITLGNVEYEKPMITELFGNQWKGKADIVNHDEKLIIDLKIPRKLKEVGINQKDIKMLAEDALKQQRLLINNPREVDLKDVVSIYEASY